MSKKDNSTPLSAARLIQDLEDGDLAAEDRARLMEMLRTDKEVRRLYIRHIELASSLKMLAKSKAEMGELGHYFQDRHAQKRRAVVMSMIYTMAAVFLIGISFLFYKMKLPAGDPNFAVHFQASGEASYRVNHVDRGDGNMQLKAGDTVSIDRGLLKCDFPNGVEAIVEGPCNFKILTDNSVKMSKGHAWFRVPEAGHGFAVHTDKVKIVDLGTEFGIRFTDEGNMQAHVQRGRVRADLLSNGAELREIVANEAVEFDPAGRFKDVEYSPSLFRREYSYQPLYVHWSFDELKDGAFEADGSLVGVEQVGVEVKGGAGDAVETSKASIEGVFDGAFSMRNEKIYGLSSYPGVGGNAPRSFAVWVRHRKDVWRNQSTPFCIWGSREVGGLWKMSVMGNERKLYLATNQTGYYTRFPKELDNEWVHVAIVYTGGVDAHGYGEVIFYINGVKQETFIKKYKKDATAINTDISSPLAGTLQFGRDDADPTWDGDLDEAYLIRGVLSELDIQRLMNENRLFYKE